MPRRTRGPASPRPTRIAAALAATPRRDSPQGLRLRLAPVGALVRGPRDRALPGRASRGLRLHDRVRRARTVPSDHRLGLLGHRARAPLPRCPGPNRPRRRPASAPRPAPDHRPRAASPDPTSQRHRRPADRRRHRPHYRARGPRHRDSPAPVRRRIAPLRARGPHTRRSRGQARWFAAAPTPLQDRPRGPRPGRRLRPRPPRPDRPDRRAGRLARDPRRTTRPGVHQPPTGQPDVAADLRPTRSPASSRNEPSQPDSPAAGSAATRCERGTPPAPPSPASASTGSTPKPAIAASTSSSTATSAPSKACRPPPAATSGYDRFLERNHRPYAIIAEMRSSACGGVELHDEVAAWLDAPD